MAVHKKQHNKPHKNRKRTGENPSPNGVTPSLEMLYGAHTVLEALNNPKRKISRLLATENATKRFADKLAAPRLQIESVKPAEISKITGADAVHQGLLALAQPLREPHLHELAECDGPILILDQITDPHNVGAIIRSAAAFGAAGLIMTARHSPQASGVLAKSASGGLEHVPILKVTNLSSAIASLMKSGVICIGLDSEAEMCLEDAVNGVEKLAIVLGAEGKGLRQKTRETCTNLARLDMPGAIASLNVSNAAALALYAVSRRVL